VQKTVCGGACEGVAEGAQREDSRVEETCVGLDVQGREEVRSLRVESLERGEGLVGVG
jgi:hypothetical protein